MIELNLSELLIGMVRPKGPEEWEIVNPTLDRMFEKLESEE